MEAAKELQKEKEQLEAAESAAAQVDAAAQ